MLQVPFQLAGQGQAAELIPPGSTTFHLLLAVHIAAALTCVATGTIAALSPKRPGRHPHLGTLYSRSLWVVVASAAWLAALRWPQDASLWPSAPCRLPPPPSAAPPGVDDGNGGAGAGSGYTLPA
jgi:hypothetical protein